jgi:hypothetical protein
LEPVSIESVCGIDQIPCNASGSISIVQDLDLGGNRSVAMLINTVWNTRRTVDNIRDVSPRQGGGACNYVEVDLVT